MKPRALFVIAALAVAALMLALPQAQTSTIGPWPSSTSFIVPASAVNGGGGFVVPLLGPDGTTSAPSYAFTSAPTNGMYNANGPAFTRAGTTAFNIDNTAATLTNGYSLGFSAGAAGAVDLMFSRRAAGQYGITAVLFANLGTPANGSFCYCSDCTIANPCAGGGTGAFAKRLNGVWVCN